MVVNFTVENRVVFLQFSAFLLIVVVFIALERNLFFLLLQLSFCVEEPVLDSLVFQLLILEGLFVVVAIEPSSVDLIFQSLYFVFFRHNCLVHIIQILLICLYLVVLLINVQIQLKTAYN